MQSWQVDTVYHAAAYKHVPMVEKNIAEGVVNNTFGTLYAAQAAVSAGVRNFVLISTDKAVRPTNVMGSTKRLAELILQALAAEPAPLLHGSTDGRRATNKTRFTMVRFGNVLGSSGSVIPLFRQQIRKGGPVTVTHPEITRYFMTIPEAAQLVIQAGSMGEGGDVFVLDMGESVKIAKLAEKMIKLSGLSVRSARNIDGDIAIEFTGLRPGEKLYEELLIGDNVTDTGHPMIMRAEEKKLDWTALSAALTRMDHALKTDDYPGVQRLFLELVDGYRPDKAIVDLLHRQQAPAARGSAAASRAGA
jgi:FlaA1/EpsC-like NDP-sugar epimerase